MKRAQKYTIDKITSPIQRFMQLERSGGIVILISVVLALLFANTSLSSTYRHFFEQEFGFQFNGETFLKHDLLHWINDGLMAVFFFVIGLELKRELVSGELANPKKAILPIIAAIGGMIVPALIYLFFNPNGEAQAGWGIPMATDIAFALSVIYSLGKRIPLSLKVFLAALAIVDDLGAVLVIALFYTSEISINYLLLGFIFLGVMYLGKKWGIRNIFFYAVLGIAGVWVSFLLSGVHATIAAVLTAFIIPSDVKIKETVFSEKIKKQLDTFNHLDKNDQVEALTNEQVQILHEIKTITNDATPPLQRLEHLLHPIVTFIIIPIFAFANAGVSFLDISLETLFSTSILVGVTLGLFVGKIIGVVGFTWLSIKIKVANYPSGMNLKNLVGIGFLAAIGFTMSLFVTSLAFSNPLYQTQAKVGIFIASILGAVIGYFLLKSAHKN